MSPRLAPSSLRLALLAVFALTAASCGGDDAPPVEADLGGLPDGAPADAGHGDGGARDAAQVDAGDVDSFVCADSDGDGHAEVACGGDDCDDHDPSRYPGATEVCDLDDEDCDDATYGADADADGFESALCCNGAGNCGADCDDSNVNVNPDATEVCNGGIDDDCNGLADDADGVCVSCPTGFSGFDGICADIDECAAGAPCGGAAGAACANDPPGSYTCSCPAGYVGAATGGTCVDVDECAAGAPCGTTATGCSNTVGGYICSCAPGYGAPAIGGACADLDECALGLCGAGMTSCTNTVGSYSCACAAGYSSAAGQPCRDLDECATTTLCGVQQASCANISGSYVCGCNTGYAAPASGGSCVDVDECLLAATCGVERASCTNTTGGYVCGCNAGYEAPATGGACADIDECVLGLCGGSMTSCTNTVGSYQCACNAGYAAPATGGACLDINECALGTDDCDRDPAATCANTVGSFTCACPDGFASPAGDARGAGGCLLSDPLSSLVPSAGALSPVFAGGTTTYTLMAPLGATSVTLTPSVAYPTRATITVDGVAVASGAASAPISVPLGFAPRSVRVTVMTETGMTRAYTVVLRRYSPYVKASNTEANDWFGYALSLSADGTRLAVGAANEASSATGVGGDQTDNRAGGSGAVYVFARTGTTWTQETYLKASNTGQWDTFGCAVSLSADGTRLAVGANGESSSATIINGSQTDDGASDSGAVYVFSRTGADWTQEAYIKASNTGARDHFGSSVSLSADGTRLAVGAYGEASSATDVDSNQADNAAAYSGAVYVFSRTGTTWTQEAYIKASNTGQWDTFGCAVSLSADGTRLAVGANGEDSSATGVGGDQTNNSAGASGAVYVFARTGTTWTQEAYVKASNTDSVDNFGGSVSLSADGTRLAVAAPSEASSATGVDGDQADNSANASGAVYVY